MGVGAGGVEGCGWGDSMGVSDALMGKLGRRRTKHPREKMLIRTQKTNTNRGADKLIVRRRRRRYEAGCGVS